jgi:hypothetical protein
MGSPAELGESADSQPPLPLQASSTPEDWFGSAWPRQNGMPDPSLLLGREGPVFPQAPLLFLFQMVTV